MTDIEQKNIDYITARLGKVYTETTLDNFRGESAQRVKDHFLSGKSVYLFGACGRGKTHLLAGLAHVMAGKRYAIAKGNTMNDIASDIYGEHHGSYIRIWSTTPVLMIDDIGAGKLTQEREKFYYTILDYRSSNRLQTIYTSNLKTDELWRGDLNEDPARIIRRIRENCEGVQL